MRRTTTILLMLFLATGFAAGQVNRYGIPHIVNYPPEITNGSEQNWAVVQDQRGIIYIGNDEKGVIEYDGSVWRTIPVTNNSLVRSLACSDDGTVYVGAVSEIGMLAPDAAGNLRYRSLVPLVDTSVRFFDVWKIYTVQEKVYFHTQKYLLIYHSDLDSMSVVRNERHVLFGFHEQGHFYTGGFSKGLLRLEGDSAFVVAEGGDFYREKNIFGLTSYDEGQLLIGINYHNQPRSELTLYNTATGIVDTLFTDREVTDFLSENYLTNLQALSDGTFIASTMAGGFAIITRDGRLSEVISKAQGLQNQTVFYAYESGGSPYPPTIWTAMGIGVAKTSVGSPLRTFTERDGFQGLIHTVNSIDDKIFIGTLNGIYHLNRNNVFEKTGTINQNVFDLQKYRLEGGEEILLAIGEGGLLQVHKDGRVVNVKDNFSSDLAEEERVFWGYCILVDPYHPDKIYIGRENSIAALFYKNGKWNQEFSVENLDNEIRTLAMNQEDKLWYGMKSTGIGYLVNLHGEKEVVNQYLGVENGLPDASRNSIFMADGRLLAGTLNGIYRVLEDRDSILIVPDTVLNRYLPDGRNTVLRIYEDPASNLWISFENDNMGWMIARLEKTGDSGDPWKATMKPFYVMDSNFSTDAFHSVTGDDVWFTESNILYHFDQQKPMIEGQFKALIRKVTVDDDTVIYNGAYPGEEIHGRYRVGQMQDQGKVPGLKYADNNIEFRWSAPYFVYEDKIEYSYFLEGFSSDWSGWDNVLYQDFTNLPHGNYTFRIRARNVYGDESLSDEFSFTINRPWYLTYVAFLGYVIIAVLIVYVIIILYTRRLKNENIRLEGIIQERTAEIRKQKEELTDSIEYASRIQRALLPPDQILKGQGLDYFILFRPRDIVSGDFYWFTKNNGKIFIVAADCTGHGVPGAFMSMLGISFLDEIVVKSGISDTNKILDALRNHVITSLRQTGETEDESTKDGMDLAMVSIDEKTKKVQYSGAYNPLYAVRELTDEEKQKIDTGEELELNRGTVYNETHLLYQVKADHMPIGISEKTYNFKSEIIEEQDATFYLFSDGYVDQFGGPSGKKFMSRNFKKLLLEVQQLSMEEQKEKLNQELVSWMGDTSQIDDVLVIGIRIKRG